MARIADGDQQALATLYDVTNKLVYGLTLRITGNASAAEETLLDVYMQIWRQAARFDHQRGRPLAWLMTIARSRAIDRWRAGQTGQHRELDEQTPALAAATDLEETVAAAERQQIVRAALDLLPPEQREVIELAYYSGLSHSEIAAHLDQPLGTVKTRVRLAMLKLRESLKAARGL